MALFAAATRSVPPPWAATGAAGQGADESGLGGRHRRGRRRYVTGCQARSAVASTRPVAVSYRITPLGKTLRHPVDVLLAWTARHMPAVERAREEFDERDAGSRTGPQA